MFAAVKLTVLGEQVVKIFALNYITTLVNCKILVIFELLISFMACKNLLVDLVPTYRIIKCAVVGLLTGVGLVWLRFE